MKKRVNLFGCVTAMVLILAGGMASTAEPPRDNNFVLLASTIGPIDAGIVDALADSFEKETGIRVRHVGAGTGAALKMAESGQFDLVLAHAISLEEKFVQDGFGTRRVPLMYNDFVIVGPVADPAGIRGMKTAAEALRTISSRQVPFISRGDRSGTHMAEMDLWKAAGIAPSGPWYQVFEGGARGNVVTLRHTNDRGIYTVIDRATVLALRKEIKLEILVERDTAMLNFMTLIPVNQARFPRVNAVAAARFVDWMTAPDKGQLIIRDFGKDKFGEPMFFPNSAAWRERPGK